MKPEGCRHGSIVTYAISDGGNERIWACADCMLRFYPACRVCVDVGHRNEEHVGRSWREASRELIANGDDECHPGCDLCQVLNESDTTETQA